MLLQTNSYIVPRDRRMEHARLLRRFRQTLLRLGCDHFEVFEQVGTNWNTGETTGRFVQIMRFRDRKHQLAVQAAERSDPTAQSLVREFCELINFPYQQQQGLFAVGFYTSFLRMPPQRTTTATVVEESQGEAAAESPDAIPIQGQQQELTGSDEADGADAFGDETAADAAGDDGSEGVAQGPEAPAEDGEADEASRMFVEDDETLPQQ